MPAISAPPCRTTAKPSNKPGRVPFGSGCFSPTPAALLTSLTPDRAVALGTAGLCLGFVEFNRPGRVLPGAVGLLLFLFASASLIQHGVHPAACALLACSTAVLLANLVRRLPLWLLALATLALILGLRWLVPSRAPQSVHLPVAVVCGAILGTLSGALTRVAYRARRSKALD